MQLLFSTTTKTIKSMSIKLYIIIIIIIMSICDKMSDKERSKAEK